MLLRNIKHEKIKSNAIQNEQFNGSSDTQKQVDEIESLKDMIHNLPEKYRSVFELITLGFTEKEISNKLSISMGTVKSRKSRGREMLQRLWR